MVWLYFLLGFAKQRVCTLFSKQFRGLGVCRHFNYDAAFSSGYRILQVSQPQPVCRLSPVFWFVCCHVRVRFPEMRRRNPEDLGRLANGIPRERYVSTHCVPRGRCGVWGAKRSSTADFGSEMLVVGWFDGWRVRDICRNEDSQSFCRNGREASGKPYGMSPVFFLAFRGPLYHFFLRFSVVCR